VLAEAGVVEVVDRRADDAEAGRQQSLLGEVVDRGQQLSSTEVAGGAEDDHEGRVANAKIKETLG
jgi:hypothetical protein